MNTHVIAFWGGGRKAWEEKQMNLASKLLYGGQKRERSDIQFPGKCQPSSKQLDGEL